jgi:hypothetical protein
MLEGTTMESLFERATWETLCVLVQLRPAADVLPVRMRRHSAEPFTISVTSFTTAVSCWYTLADVLAAKLLGGGKIPRIDRAVEFYAETPDPNMQSTTLRGQVSLDPYGTMFKTIVEQRQIAKRHSAHDSDGRRLDMALKLMANSGAYGIFAEVNVVAAETKEGHVYSDVDFAVEASSDERPGRYCNPFIASFVTGAARLLLAMLETEVAQRGGTFAFCDTDSLAIVSARPRDRNIAWLKANDIDEVIARFDTLNPYDRLVVPSILKKEHENALCWPISAKRYCLYRNESGKRVRIIKASESGLGAIMGRTRNESTPTLARRIWIGILHRELRIKPTGERKARLERLLRFDVPLRRKLPLCQPHVLNRDALRRYNAARSYAHRLKPFNFVQVLTPAMTLGADVIPLAPFERDLTKARKLPWMDVTTGRSIEIDWSNAGYSGTVGIATLAEYIERYAEHSESKAADHDGRPAGASHRGMLGRLHVFAARRSHIGKEVNRLDEEAGTALEPGAVETYVGAEPDSFRNAVAAIAGKPRAELAAELGVSERRLRDILKGRAKPRRGLRERIERLGTTPKCS